MVLLNSMSSYLIVTHGFYLGLALSRQPSAFLWAVVVIIIILDDGAYCLLVRTPVRLIRSVKEITSRLCIGRNRNYIFEDRPVNDGVGKDVTATRSCSLQQSGSRPLPHWEIWAAASGLATGNHLNMTLLKVVKAVRRGKSRSLAKLVELGPYLVNCC